MSRKIQKNIAAEKSKETDFSIKKYVENPLTSTYLPVLIFVLITFTLRWRLLDIPLERDEGGFAYMGYTWLQGIPLFSHSVDAKPPLLYILYGIFELLFGATPKGIHTGLFVFNLGFTITFFFLLKKKFGLGTAIFSSLVFILISSLPNVFGFAAHATQLLLWPAIIGILLVDNCIDKAKIYLLVPAGICLGLAFLIKQQAICFMLFAGFYLTYITLIKNKDWKKWLITGSILTISSVFPYLLCLAWFYYTGHLDTFWYWTYELPVQYASTKSGGFEVFKMMYGVVTQNIEILWYTGIVGIFISFLDKWKPELKVFSVLLLVFSFLALSVGFAFYAHYFVLTLPAISLGVGLILHFLFGVMIKLTNKNMIAYPIVIFAFLLLFFTAYKPNKDYFNKTKKADIIRNVYGINPFQETYILGKKINSMAQPGDSILVLGSEPQLLFYTKLPTISQHLHYYSFVDGGPQNDSLQTQLITKVEKSKPKYFVFVRSGFSWLVKDPKNKLFQWIDTFIPNYNLKGIINIYPDKPSEYLWDNDARIEKIGEGDVVLFFELKQ